ncbi:MAG: type IV pilus modification protein PilV [Gammaproteobacteria bacterium HGW-Gammaproteobacteria-14]|nr:MAG: type IV pilus modification protein PilV [Gammaproteobacteria bacterium HGW-Gammaproteobacteria-14]
MSAIMFSASRQRGVGMVEILIALLVVAVGVLGYAGMQLYALRGAEDASYRTIATLIARDGLERTLINENPDAYAIYFDEGQWPDAPVARGGAYPNTCIGNNVCNPQQAANADINELAWLAANSLPNGMVMGRDDCAGPLTPSCLVVSWGETTVPSDCVGAGGIDPDSACVVLEVLRP